MRVCKKGDCSGRSDRSLGSVVLSSLCGEWTMRLLETLNVCRDSLWGTSNVPLDYPERF